MAGLYRNVPNCQKTVHCATFAGYNHLILNKQPRRETMVNVSDGAKEKLLEYLKNSKSDLAVRVVLSHG